MNNSQRSKKWDEYKYRIEEALNSGRYTPSEKNAMIDRLIKEVPISRVHLNTLRNVKIGEKASTTLDKLLRISKILGFPSVESLVNDKDLVS